MPKVKKSRKVGQIGVRSVPKADRAPNQPSGRVRKKTGKPAGSRQNVSSIQNAQNKGNKQLKDARHGSKKPVALVVDAQAVKKVAKPKSYFSPKEELNAIESDARLDLLLNKLDSGKKVTQEEQQYVDQLLARHKVLCDLLGISTDEDEDQAEPDLMDKFEHSNLDGYR